MKDNTTDNLYMFKTSDQKFWRTQLKSMATDGNKKSISIDGITNIEFDPAIPYIYYPNNKFTKATMKPIDDMLNLGVDFDCESAS